MRSIAIIMIAMPLLGSMPLLAELPQMPRELVGRHNGGVGQSGLATKDGTIVFNESDCVLGGVEIKADGTLLVPFAEKGEEFRTLEFKTVKEHITDATVSWEPLVVGGDEFSATLQRYGAVFRVLVKMRRGDEVRSGIQWICAGP